MSLARVKGLIQYSVYLTSLKTYTSKNMALFANLQNPCRTLTKEPKNKSMNCLSMHEHVCLQPLSM